MNSLFDSHAFPHVLAFLVLLSRIGDALSTYFVSPTLLLETNPLVSRGGKMSLVGGLLAFLVPYYSPGLGVTVLTTSTLVVGSNLSRGWIARALGEAEYHAVMLRAARRGRLGATLGFVLSAAACPLLIGCLAIALSRGPEDWGYWFGWGLACYGIVLGLYGCLFATKLFRRAVAAPLDA